MRHQPFQCPFDIAGIVAGEAQFGARFHHAGELIQHLHLDEAALVMTRLGPGIGKEKKTRPERRIGQRLDDVARIAFIEADIGGRASSAAAFDSSFAMPET